MERMCYSRQYYNQLKRKQYEEYLKRQNKYYLYKKKYDKEHHKRNNDAFANKRKCDKTYTSESEFFNSFKTGSIEDNNINDDCKKNNSYGSSEINIKKNNLKYKKHASAKCHNLENKNCTSIKDSYNEEFLEEDHNTVEKEELPKETKHKPVKKIDKNYYHNKPYNNTNKNQVNKCTIESCKATVSSETLPLCENIPHTSDVTAGPVTVKIPVVLTECNITINVQSSLKLEDTVLEIKHIKKNAYLNQCKLILNSENDKPNTGILFLAGFIRKNIEYSAKEHNDKCVLNGKLKHVTVNVPFKCTTRVTFNTPPKFKATTPQDEVEILQTSIEVRNPCGEEITGRDIREQSFRLIEFFNEKVFCELISAEFVESDILENPTNKECKSPLEQTFHEITEKVVLFLTIKLLQNQNVIIPQ